MSVIAKNAKNVAGNAKNIAYAVVGAGDAALQSAKGLPARAKALPKRAQKLRSLAAGALKDASKRFDRYVVRGRRLVQRNGSKPKVVRSSKPKAYVPAVEAPAGATPLVQTTPPDVQAEVLG